MSAAILHHPLERSLPTWFLRVVSYYKRCSVSVIHFHWLHERTAPVSSSLTKNSLHSFFHFSRCYMPVPSYFVAFLQSPPLRQKALSIPASSFLPQ